LEQSLDSGGSQEERCVPSYIDDGGFWRRSVMEARRRVRVVLREQGGGTVWRVVASMAPGERLHFGLTPWRWVRGETRGGVI
jgi:hypothetical protein